MTVDVSQSNETDVAEISSEMESLVAEKPAEASSLKRANRWKRRARHKWVKQIYLVAGCLVAGFAAAAIFSPKPIKMQQGLEGPFANAIFEAFPEAEPLKIDTWYKGDLPQIATLHLPAYLIEPDQGIGNPFARLGAEFGGVERTLSGIEMASRLEQIGDKVLSDDMLRCHSYEIGAISSEPESPRRTRILHLHLNPGC